MHRTIKITIDENGEFAGAGILRDGRIEDCPAILGSDAICEDAYAAIEEAIASGDTFTEIGEYRWTWTWTRVPPLTGRIFFTVGGANTPPALQGDRTFYAVRYDHEYAIESVQRSIARRTGRTVISFHRTIYDRNSKTEHFECQIGAPCSPSVGGYYPTHRFTVFVRGE